MGETRHTRRRFLQGGAGAALGIALARTGSPQRAGAASPPPPAQAPPGELRPFAGDYVPKGFLACTGERISRADHPALFSLVGTTYGGDGVTTFALPDPRGRVTAGPDERLGQDEGETSGLGSDPLRVIPYTVVHWGIAERGEFPERS
jgi:hypothetical protein